MIKLTKEGGQTHPFFDDSDCIFFDGFKLNLEITASACTANWLVPNPAATRQN
jgi:hypothetical protein